MRASILRSCSEFGLSFTESATSFAEWGVYAVGKVEDEVGGGGLQGLIYGFFRSLWVSHQQVVTDSSAEKGIALRDIYEVLAGLRRDGMTGFKWMFGGYQEYLSLLWRCQCQQ